MKSTPVAIIGASGYTGAELIRLILGHPRLELEGLYGRRHAGETLADTFPQFAGIVDEVILPYAADTVAAEAEVVFLALPHGESAHAAAELYERGLTVLDLSADFRLRSPEIYAQWYGATHAHAKLLPLAKYGLVERHRKELAGARLVAVPGCYPTATLLTLAPLLEQKLISPDGIVVDAKSGVSGAGRSPSQMTHFPEVCEGIRAYKVAEHRHTPEIEQELAHAAGRDVHLVFTPHLVPMNRGILATCYATPTSDKLTTDNLRGALRETYAGEPFVTVVEHPPDPSHVRGSNRAQVTAWVDPRAKRVIAMGVIDNLVKGAAGQALQCLNALKGWPETEGLDSVGIFP